MWCLATPSQNKAWKEYHLFLGGLMKTEAVSAFVYQLSTMAYFFIFMYFF